MTDHAAEKGLWGPLTADPERMLHGIFGPLHVWIRHAETDWFYAFKHADDTSHQLSLDSVSDAPGDVKWNRLGCEARQHQLELAPCLPNRAVVVRPEMPFTILPGDRIQFFVRIPLWIQVLAADHRRAVWCDLPSRVISKTWFGSVEEGEAAYALRTTAVRSMADLPRDPDRIVCPVRLRNQSEDPLRLDRICLRVQNLEVYQGDTGLWTNEAGVTYRGDNQWNRVVYGRAAPPFDQAREKLASAREPARGAFTLKSIASGSLFS